MRLLVDARPLFDRAPGGVTRVAAGLLPALCQNGNEHSWTLAATGFSRLKLPTDFPDHVQLIQRRAPNKFLNGLIAADLTAFDRLWPRQAFDHLLLTNLGFVGTPRLPYSLIVHDASFAIEPHWFKPKARLWHRVVRARQLIQRARHLFAVSETTKRDLIERFQIADEKVHVIPLGLSPAPTQQVALPDCLREKRFVLALGRGDPRKNSACAIAAVERVRETYDLTLVLVGAMKDGVMHQPWIVPLSRPTDEALATLAAHAQTFLYPSWYEGFGLPLHEAARFGTPCIASTAGALPETAPDGTLFAPPTKPHLWTELINEILDHPADHRTTTSLGNWNDAARIILDRLNRQA